MFDPALGMAADGCRERAGHPGAGIDYVRLAGFDQSCDGGPVFCPGVSACDEGVFRFKAKGRSVLAARQGGPVATMIRTRFGGRSMASPQRHYQLSNPGGRWFALPPCRRATSFTVPPDTSVPETIRPFASSHKRRIAAGGRQQRHKPNGLHLALPINSH